MEATTIRKCSQINEEATTAAAATVIPRKALKPLCKKTFDTQMAVCMETIESLMKTLKKSQFDSELLASNLKTLKEEKNLAFREKKASEERTLSMSAEINKLSETQSKLQAKLHYRDEKKLDDAIRKLNAHLSTSNFPLSQEKKIVAEIDVLNRSKKIIGQYNDVRTELTELKLLQRSHREMRDKTVKRLTALRKEEEVIRQKLTKIKSQEQEIKIELDEQHELKRWLKSEFVTQQKHHSYMLAELHRSQAEARQVEKQEMAQARRKEKKELKALREPYEEERQLCSLLLQYVQSFQPPKVSVSVIDHGNEVPAEIEGMHALPRKTNSDEQQVNSKKSKRKSKIDRKKNKLLIHTPQTLAQFLSVDLPPPTSAAGIPECISAIKEKIQQYNYFAKQKHFTRDSDKPTTSDPCNASIDVPEIDDFKPEELVEQSEADSFCFQEETVAQLDREQCEPYWRSEEEFIHISPDGFSEHFTKQAQYGVSRGTTVDSLLNTVIISRV